MKIIIWGYPLHSHTHSYIHAGYYNAFKTLGYETYWIDGRDNFDPQLFNDALIFTEQWAVIGNPNIPLFTNSTYAVHYIGNKDTRVEGNPGAGAYLGKVGRLIDVRYNADKWVDKNYNYSLDRSKATKIGAGCYFEKGSDYDYFYRMIVKNKMKGLATKKEELLGIFRRGGFSSTINFWDSFQEEIKIRYDNKQNILIIVVIFIYKFVRNIDKVFK